MAAFAVLVFVLLFLIYFVVKNQNLQNQLKTSTQALRFNTNQIRFATKALSAVSEELQQTYLARLTSAHKRGLISNDNFDVAKAILSNVHFVVTQCFERQSTVEEAMKKVAISTGMDMKTVNAFIAAQPSEVRVAWCKNTLGGFLKACQHISLAKLNPEVADKALSQEAS